TDKVELKEDLRAELQLAHIGAGARDLAEVGADHAGVRVAQIQVVRRVERLEAELQPDALGEVEDLQQRRIPLHETRPDDGVPSHVPECAQRLQRKERSVEPFARIALIAGQFGRAAGNLVRAIKARAGIRLVAPADHRYREARLNVEQSAQFPAADQQIGQSSLIEQT